jgi:sirohydrochlorin cobaltochelatase
MIAIKIGVMLCGYGSRFDEGSKQLGELKEKLDCHIPNYPVEYGFFDLTMSDLRGGLDKLCNQGVDHILALTCMLFSDDIVKNEIMGILAQYAADRIDLGLKIELAGPLDIEPKILYAAEGSIVGAETAANAQVSRENTLLMVVGRGSSNPDANSNISKVCRMLWEGLGYGWGEVCYTEDTFPLVASGLEHAAMLDYKRIIVFPYFLFTGPFVEHIYAETDDIALKFPNIEFIKASHLNNHRGVLEALEGRVRGILNDEKNMNCMLCEYREQITGLRQNQSHHHGEGVIKGRAQEKHLHDHSHNHNHSKRNAEIQMEPVHSHKPEKQNLSDAE